MLTPVTIKSFPVFSASHTVSLCLYLPHCRPDPSRMSVLTTCTERDLF